MAIQRSGNFLSQQRLDAPHLKSIESGVTFDFDTLVGLALSGKKSLVIKGLVLNASGMIGQSASNLSLAVAGETAIISASILSSLRIRQLLILSSLLTLMQMKK